MGIAGFFLWLQRWYENCITKIPDAVVKAAEAGDTAALSQSKRFRGDILYVDMNGLIHPCCHDTAPLPEPENEEEMICRIFQSLDVLVRVAQPRKSLVLCIDGVAPRSKMNQQRSRRFRAAEERLEGDEIAKSCADRVEKEMHLPRPTVRTRWDHNQITPSTDFMERVGIALEWFIVRKLNDDPVWRPLTVVFSDAHVPGEGEHKLMECIRGLRAQPGHDPKTSHVIHGMDADLICLGLTTHEENVSILRNQLTETFQPDTSRFCYFDLRRFRERLREDFANIPNMKFERVLDDYVFLCFFVGNDFLPHVPLISIKTKGIEMLLDSYVRDFEAFGYLTKGGEIDFDNVRRFLQLVVKKSYRKLQKEYYGVMRAKERAKQNVAERLTAAQEEIDAQKESLEPDGSNAQEVSNAIFSTMASAEKEQARFVADRQTLEFSYLSDDFRDAYYQHKLGWDPADKKTFEANIKALCNEYLRGTQWVLRYYTQGCPSWSWYFPHHYAPLLQDLAEFSGKVNTTMEKSAPLHPVVQLLAVLPRPSAHAVPEALQGPVNDPDSKLGVFYPDHVDVDFSEANFSYQGVLRIPFIDCKRLSKTVLDLVDLEVDQGSPLLFVHESHPLCGPLDHLVTSTSSGASGAATAVTIPPHVAALAPVAGQVGAYAYEPPSHARIDCPDPALVSHKVPYTASIDDNAVHCYRYDTSVAGAYQQKVLGAASQKAKKRSRSASPAKAHSEEATAASPTKKTKKNKKSAGTVAAAKATKKSAQAPLKKKRKQPQMHVTPEQTEVREKTKKQIQKAMNALATAQASSDEAHQAPRNKKKKKAKKVTHTGAAPTITTSSATAAVATAASKAKKKKSKKKHTSDVKKEAHVSAKVHTKANDARSVHHPSSDATLRSKKAHKKGKKLSHH